VCWGGFVDVRGKLAALMESVLEILIIGGAAIGAFLVANPMTTVKKAAGSAPEDASLPSFPGSRFLSGTVPGGFMRCSTRVRREGMNVD